MFSHRRILRQREREREAIEDQAIAPTDATRTGESNG
jgi:hypothetical protein